MKSAYELAMERLQKDGPIYTLNEEQKAQIAQIEDKCRARVAERKLSLHDQMDKARAAANFVEAEKLEKELAAEIVRLEEKCESEKDQVRKEPGHDSPSRE